MTEVSAKMMVVVQAIKHAIVTSNTPGLSVNNHPNAFFLNVIGSLDLAKAAESVLTALERYEQGLAAKFEFEVKQLIDKIKAEAKLGAVSVEDALARMKAKAGGELLVAEHVLEAASQRVKWVFQVAAPKKETDPATAASAVDGH